MKKWGVYLLILISLAAVVIYHMPYKPKQPRYNVVLVTYDALRADRLGVYGYDGGTTPNIDAFGHRSYVFKDAVSQCGSTVCSLPSILTSEFPDVDSLGYSKSLVEVLRKNGYSTFAVVSHEYARPKYYVAGGFEIFDENFIGRG